MSGKRERESKRERGESWGVRCRLERESEERRRERGFTHCRGPNPSPSPKSSVGEVSPRKNYIRDTHTHTLSRPQ